MNENTEILNVTLMGKELTIKAPTANIENLQKAAHLFNEKIDDICKSKPALNNERILLMTGLNLAYELIDAQKQKDDYLLSVNQKIKRLQKRLDDSLAPKNQELF